MYTLTASISQLNTQHLMLQNHILEAMWNCINQIQTNEPGWLAQRKVRRIQSVSVNYDLKKLKL